MTTLGDPIFAKNPDGTPKSKVGTLFLRTPGLVTVRGVHALQRAAWLEELERRRAAAGQGPLSANEAADELAESVDLLFSDDDVLIRPDPERMDLAFRADEALQTLVSKRRIRFLNTHAAKVRDALRARGENWRMARAPMTTEELTRRVEAAKCAIAGEPIYHYNGNTGTRWITAGGYTRVCALPPDAYRAQLREIVDGLRARNRLGQPEIDLFPPGVPTELRLRFRALDATLPDAELRAAADALAVDYRAAVPAELRTETLGNLAFRNAMFATLNRGPNETGASEQDLIQGISPEFYRQIEWLPGGRVENGELIFDPLYDEAERTRDPKLLDLCDHRVRSIVFNLLRLFGTVEYVNVGRIAHSLASGASVGNRRGGVYIIQYKEAGVPLARLFVIRFQKWGIAEHLDEGKDLLTAMVLANDYADYILDRRLACRQLGMNLPNHLGFGAFAEGYRGANQYNGTTVRAYYYVRSYVPGTASDKVPVERFRNPAFARRFAELMGEAAALDLVTGRRAAETGETLFDRRYEVLQCGATGLPQRLVVTDHRGTFTDYLVPFEDRVAAYSAPVTGRERIVPDYADFAKAYVEAFRRRLSAVKAAYAEKPRAFDNLFAHRPFDVGGSMAYRWHCTLERLKACDPDAVAVALKRAIQTA